MIVQNIRFSFIELFLTLIVVHTYNETQLHQIRQPHGMVHIDLKCTMEPQETAAYDPIFWLHHSFVDKVWAERQNNPDLPQMTSIDLEDNILEPFGGT